MAINEHAEIFFGQEVRQYNGVADWKGPNYAYRLGVDYDASQGKLEGLLDQLAEQRDVGKLTALIIGFWGPESDTPSDQVVKKLVALKDHFTGLKAIFLGDIIMEENEISWIVQSDVAPLLQAFSGLECIGSA